MVNQIAQNNYIYNVSLSADLWITIFSSLLLFKFRIAVIQSIFEIEKLGYLSKFLEKIVLSKSGVENRCYHLKKCKFCCACAQ
jgi:hypothetical protein